MNSCQLWTLFLTSFIKSTNRFPNLKSVRELILKRGLAKINEKKVPLTDNTVIEQHLGKYNNYGKTFSVSDLCFGVTQSFNSQTLFNDVIVVFKIFTCIQNIPKQIKMF